MLHRYVPRQCVGDPGTAQGSWRGAAVLPGWGSVGCQLGVVRQCPQPAGYPNAHGRSPLSAGFSHCPQMLGLLPAISARPSLPPSLPPSSGLGPVESAGLPWEPLRGSRHCCCPVCLARWPPGRDDLRLAARLGQYGSSGGQDGPPGTQRCWGCTTRCGRAGEQGVRGGGQPHGASSA